MAHVSVACGNFIYLARAMAEEQEIRSWSSGKAFPLSIIMIIIINNILYYNDIYNFIIIMIVVCQL